MRDSPYMRLQKLTTGLPPKEKEIARQLIRLREQGMYCVGDLQSDAARGWRAVKAVARIAEAPDFEENLILTQVPVLALPWGAQCTRCRTSGRAVGVRLDVGSRLLLPVLEFGGREGPGVWFRFAAGVPHVERDQKDLDPTQ